MLELHRLFENWLLEASAGSLRPWKASLTLGHLKGCARCRDFASNLALSLAESPATPSGAWEGKDDAFVLHARIMAAYRNERNRQGFGKLTKAAAWQTRFGVTPRFVKAMGVVALGLGLIVMLTQP